MFTPAVDEVVELALKVAGVEPGKPRGEAAVAFALEAVAGRAGADRAAVAAAHCDNLACSAEGWIPTILHAAATAERGDSEERQQPSHRFRNRCRGHLFHRGKDDALGVRIALTAALLLIGCDQIRVEPNQADSIAVARGKVAAQRLGCGACHVIPGIWPHGTTGPSLARFADRGVIAGRLPNRPDALAAFLLDPSGTAMPRQPITPPEAADIAAYLHAADAP